MRDSVLTNIFTWHKFNDAIYKYIINEKATCVRRVVVVVLNTGMSSLEQRHKQRCITLRLRTSQRSHISSSSMKLRRYEDRSTRSTYDDDDDDDGQNTFNIIVLFYHRTCALPSRRRART